MQPGAGEFPRRAEEHSINNLGKELQGICVIRRKPSAQVLCLQS